MTATARPQHLEALDRANAKRFHIADTRRDLRAGTRSLADVLADPVLGNLPVGRVLDWVPQYGAARVRRTLVRLNLSAGVALSALTPARREDLVRAVGSRAGYRL